jgi:hypothetical protein
VESLVPLVWEFCVSIVISGDVVVILHNLPQVRKTNVYVTWDVFVLPGCNLSVNSGRRCHWYHKELYWYLRSEKQWVGSYLGAEGEEG